MRKITLLLSIIVLNTMVISAQIIPTGLWYPIGDVTISTVTDDGDNGDGAGDGALFINGQSSVVGQGARFKFNGTMESGTNYAIDSYIYNFSGSFSRVRVSLHNITDDVELAVYVDAGTVLNGSNQLENVVFNYTAIASDVGDQLELRYVRNDDGNTARDFKIDNASLGGTFITEALPAVSSSGVWSAIGDTAITNTTNDDDNGDGLNDGAIYVDGLSAVVGQGVAFTFDEAIVNGNRYTAEATIYNSDASFSRLQLSLYNATDDVVLATSSSVVLVGGAIETTSITYDALATDNGDVLVLRFIRDDDGNTARNFSIDIAKINGAVLSTTVLGIEDNILKQGIATYPNPVSHILNIKKIDNGITIKNASLYNIIGKEVYTAINTSSIDVSNFSKGLYILKLESQEGGVLTKKVLVE
ncbi:T9SS type A sorting domain-containing protein [Flavivirga spongiicola]|uniref:T9SS type A sorting domain-containing protein n=1 Tax=Flavivirga spongiicola TaxID=421621 RepID=A0ABU7XWP8_9FLAO|nr:T9SS type A sorting domain-containing protein [Flavivirga sp. MEBiC05379]MDO5980172.1 T9SS type A sorting domain-containing protein [Flavivirga sp. MEBiC05379]